MEIAFQILNWKGSSQRNGTISALVQECRPLCKGTRPVLIIERALVPAIMHQQQCQYEAKQGSDSNSKKSEGQ